MNLKKHVYILIYLLHTACFANSPITEERKTFIVTGASGELGSATARVLATHSNLVLTGRNLSKLNELQKELSTNNSGHYEIYPLDFTDNVSRAHFKDFLNKHNFSISGLVLIAPRPQFYGKALLQEEKVWLEVLQNTFTGPVEALKIALPHLSNSSKIVVIAGTTSVQFQPDLGPSCVIRRMWTTYTKALSHHLGPQGISINTLSPGVVLTNFHEDRIQKKAQENGLSYKKQMEQEVANIPLHRHAKPEEVAHTIEFLLSENSDFINGINMILDGGYTTSY